MDFLTCIDSLKSDAFKILCLSDEKSSSLDKYIEMVRIKFVGAGTLYDWSKFSRKYIGMLNGLQYLATENYTPKQCRKIILDIVNDLSRIQNKLEAANGD